LPYQAAQEEMDQKMTQIELVYVTAAPCSLRFLSGQPAFLKSRGFTVHAISSPGRELTAFGEEEKCTVESVQMCRSICLLRDVIAVARLWSVFRRLRPHIVEAHMSKAGLLGMLSAWLARVPVRIYNNQGVAFSSCHGWRKWLLRAAESVTCRLASQVHCASSSVRHLLIDEGCCPEDRIQVLGAGSYGVDAKVRFNPDQINGSVREQVRDDVEVPRHSLVLGFVGRFATLKGVAELAGAWELLRDEFPSLYLLIIGGIEPRDPVHPDTLDRFQSDSRVRLIGNVKDPVPYYSAMDVQALPSFHEGLPLSLLEGGAMRLPIVASKIPGNVDAIQDGVTGTLVPVHDAPALAGAIRSYLLDDELRQKHGDAGRRRVVKYFQREIVWHASHRAYLELLRREHALSENEGIWLKKEKTA
jgi:glycosyltransferase involved in cell wall biosynthesis